MCKTLLLKNKISSYIIIYVFILGVYEILLNEGLRFDCCAQNWLGK